MICGTGISTCCPSTTSFDLALGPDLPRADQLYSGNLRYSAERILTSLSLLIPAFSLLRSPQLLSVLLHPAKNAPLPMYQLHASASVSCFSPGHFRRRTSRPVSYYALFESMAASEPTSWLSSKSHILFHLTLTLAPYLEVWALSLLTIQLISYSLTPIHHLYGIRSLIFFGKL